MIQNHVDIVKFIIIISIKMNREKVAGLYKMWFVFDAGVPGHNL